MATLKAATGPFSKDVSLAIEAASSRLSADEYLQYVVEKTPASFPLTELPPELRTRVYELFLSDNLIVLDLAGKYEPTIMRWQSQYEIRQEVAKRVMQPAITRISRIVRREALTVFYASTSFFLRVGPNHRLVKTAVMVWLNAIGLGNRLCIRQFYVRDEPGGYSVREDLARALDKTLRMKSVEVGCNGQILPSWWPVFKVFFELAEGEEG